MSARALRWAFLSALAFGLGAAPAARAEDAEPVIEDVLQILKDRGLVDEGQYTELMAKQQSWEAKNGPLLGRIEFSGDFRLRYENFWYGDDELGGDNANRNRLRYRLRLQGKATINDYMDAVFRLSSGEGDPRSPNRTLGTGNDFDFDALFIDQAYLVLKAPKEWVPGLTATGTVGKVPNPFLWKNSKYDLLWDADISPEGLAGQLAYKPGRDLTLLANAGYFIDDENSATSDPHVLGIQVGAQWAAAEQVELGARGGYYSWSSLDSAFLARAASFGAVGAQNYEVGELAAYARYNGIEGWPILVWGEVAKNFSVNASAAFPSDVDDQDLGWGLGVEVGDKKKLAQLGIAYFHLEANFWPSQITESDFLDGFTNRHGWAFYVTREILPNTELGMTIFLADELKEGAPYAASVSGADRVRLQTDLLVKF